MSTRRSARWMAWVIGLTTALFGGCTSDGAATGPLTGPAAQIPLAQVDQCGRSLERLGLLRDPATRCGCSTPSCYHDPAVCGPDAVCDPLVGNRCNGIVTVPPTGSGCPAGTTTSGPSCLLQVPAACTRDAQCPIGAYCDRLSGGVCAFDCLPAESCSGDTCCVGGQHCGCDGRCQAGAVDSDPSLAVAPSLSVSTPHLTFV